MKIAYMRCNGGDYFRGENPNCPLDGWSSSESKQLAEVLKTLRSENLDVTVQSLRQAGVTDATLQRTIIIEFGTEDSAFDAITPEGYLIDGKWKLLRNLGSRFR